MAGETPMEMHQIRYFLASARTLNFTRAASACNVSQPALTVAIRKLEQELGEALFERRTGGLSLTEFGQMVHPRLRAMAEQAEAARDLAHSYRKLSRAPLALGVMDTVGAGRIGGFLASLREQQPGIEVAVSGGSASGVLEGLDEGALQMAVVSDGAGIPEHLVNLPLYRERYVVAFPPGHRFETFNGVRLSDVSDEAYVDRLSCEMSDKVLAACQAADIRLYATYRSAREDWIQGLVMARMGFAFLPEYSVVVPGLPARPLVDPPISRQVTLVTSREAAKLPACKALLREARRYRWASAA
jgi:DNA-binding transcriptional LysR family regulator